jgi:hypothetical protein
MDPYVSRLDQILEKYNDLCSSVRAEEQRRVLMSTRPEGHKSFGAQLLHFFLRWRHRPRLSHPVIFHCLFPSVFSARREPLHLTGAASPCPDRSPLTPADAAHWAAPFLCQSLPPYYKVYYQQSCFGLFAAPLLRCDYVILLVQSGFDLLKIWFGNAFDTARKSVLLESNFYFF